MTEHCRVKHLCLDTAVFSCFFIPTVPNTKEANSKMKEKTLILIA